jgi:excisionase family DNA binding protein
VEEAAEQLGMGRTKVYELVAKGELASIQIGKSRRIPVQAIRDYIAERTQEAVKA